MLSKLLVDEKEFRDLRNDYCRRQCSLLSIKNTSWALTGRPKSSLFIVETEKVLGELKRKFPSEEPRWELDDSRKVLSSSGSRAERKEVIKLERERE